MTGIIFDIKEFSVHDGPGARITVFLKGCPLRCRWCHNPEGLLTKPQLMYKKSLCTHCNHCFMPCNHDECKPFKRCIHACVNGCLSVSGYEIESKILAAKLLKSSELLSELKGGITVSGGEPLMQSDFVCELIPMLKPMNTALQTSGCAHPEIYKKVIDKFDFIMQDIKLASPEKHIEYTGSDNKLILQNIEFLKKSGKPFVFRVPLIPNITDTAENLMMISEIVGSFPVELLRYNTFAGAKYDMLGMTYSLSDINNRRCDFTKFFKNAKYI